jgi:(S)-sulfolactate dehydrogenase
MRVLIAEFMEDGAVAALRRRFDTTYEAGLAERRSELVAAVHAVDALIVRNRVQVDAALLAAAPRLRVVGRLGVGLDNIDLPACAARGIEVIPATGANARSVAEYVLAAALMLLRGAYGSTAAVAAGDWPRGRLSTGRELSGKLLGIIGFGSIGRETGRLARALGMRVVGNDTEIAASAPLWVEQHTLPCRLDELLRSADVVSLHVPLTDATRNLIGAAELAAMQREAVLINTARGGVVDEAAVVAALRAGRLGGAALDVFAAEPLAGGSPLTDCPNLLLTPHIAGLTRESNLRVSSLIAEQVAAALEAARHQP